MSGKENCERTFVLFDNYHLSFPAAAPPCVWVLGGASCIIEDK